MPGERPSPGTLGDELWLSRRQDPTRGGHGWLVLHPEMRQVR